MATQRAITREMATRFINIYNTSGEVNDFIKKCFDQDECIKEFCNTNYKNLRERKFFLHIINFAILKLGKEDHDKVSNINYCREELGVPMLTITYLNAANENYHLSNKKKHSHYWRSLLHEELSDMAFEENTCAICNYSSNNCPDTIAFFYSTSFGLNTPVCYECVMSDGNGDPLMVMNAKDIDDNEDETDYVPSDDDEAEASASASEAEQAEPEPSEAEQAEPSAIEEEENQEAYDIVDDYKSGWNSGWKAAMKYVNEQVKNSETAPEPLTCDNCGLVCKLKKCTGTCNGCVKYCSRECQSIHWKLSHQYACLKK
jgi:hypothetical protein